MAYVNLPDSRLGIGVASLIGTLIGIITQRIAKELTSLQSKLQRACGNITAISRLAAKISGLKRSLNSIKSTITRIQRIVNPLDRIIRIISIAIRLLKLLPIPNSITTTGVTNTFSDILHKLKEFVKQIKDDIAIIRNACDQALLLIDRILFELTRLDDILKLCLDKANSSDPNAQDNILRQFGLDPNNVKTAVDDRNFDRLGRELFKTPRSVQDYNNLSQEEKDIFAENLGLDSKDVAKSAFCKNKDQGMSALEASQKTGLTVDETREVLESLNENSKPSSSSKNLTELRANLEDSSLYPQEPKVGLTLVTGSKEAGLFLVQQDQVKEKEIFYHTSPNGTSYEITVIETDLSFIAPKRRAIARDRSGIVRFKSDESFSSSTKVLVDEVKFNIDNNIF